MRKVGLEDEQTVTARTQKQGGHHQPPDYRSPDSHQREQGFSEKHRRAAREASGRRIEEQGRCHAIPTEGDSGQDGA